MKLADFHSEWLVPASEVHSRLDRLVKMLDAKELDAVLIEDVPGLLYFTGSAQDGYLAVDRDGGQRYVVRKSLERAAAESPLAPERFRGTVTLLGSVGGHRKSGRIGINGGAMRVSFYRRLVEAWGEDRIVDVGRDLRRLRMVKSPFEVEMCRRATRAAERGFEALARALEPGVTELELSLAVEAEMRRAGHQGWVRASNPHFELLGPMVISGDAALYPTNFSGSLGCHGQFPGSVSGAGQRVIEAKETVMGDLAACFNGYHGDNARTFTAGGEPCARAIEAHEFCRRILREIETRLVPGAICEEIYDEVIGVADELGPPEGFMGLGDNEMAFFGHGVGLELDELPVIARKVRVPLEVGMVIAVEPKAFLSGIGPVGLENTYLITDTGCESLCETDERLDGK